MVKMVYAIAQAKSSSPSNVPTRPSNASRNVRIETQIMIGTSTLTSCRVTHSGAMMDEIPSTNRMLKMLLPTMLPTARSPPAAPVSAARMPTAISGALVAKATTVSPMTSGDTPIAAASREAPRTRISAPPASRIRPSRNRNSVTGCLRIGWNVA